jgi:hypothetical protein
MILDRRHNSVLLLWMVAVIGTIIHDLKIYKATTRLISCAVLAFQFAPPQRKLLPRLKYSSNPDSVSNEKQSYKYYSIHTFTERRRRIISGVTLRQKNSNLASTRNMDTSQTKGPLPIFDEKHVETVLFVECGTSNRCHYGYKNTQK